MWKISHTHNVNPFCVGNVVMYWIKIVILLIKIVKCQLMLSNIKCVTTYSNSKKLNIIIF